MARDPVCYMDVDESTALKEKRFSQYKGRTYYFCCEDCRQRFEDSPPVYTGFADKAQQHGSTLTNPPQ